MHQRASPFVARADRDIGDEAGMAMQMVVVT
jgi:hypothetical protein